MHSIRDAQGRGYLNVDPKYAPKYGLTYEVHDFWVSEEHRDKRVGSALLKEICEMADKEQITLVLIVGSSGRLTNADLYAFYGRYGFIDEHDTAPRWDMRRPPRLRVTASADRIDLIAMEATQ